MVVLIEELVGKTVDGVLEGVALVVIHIGASLSGAIRQAAWNSWRMIWPIGSCGRRDTRPQSRC